MKRVRALEGRCLRLPRNHDELPNKSAGAR